MKQSKLKKYRLEKGLTQRDLAIQLGISVDYISQLERGVKNPGFLLSKKIADFFNTSVEDLFFKR